MAVKRKVRYQPVHTFLSDGRPVVIFPLFGESGKLCRFVLLNRETPIPVHDPDRDDVYLRVD